MSIESELLPIIYLKNILEEFSNENKTILIFINYSSVKLIIYIPKILNILNSKIIIMK